MAEIIEHNGVRIKIAGTSLVLEIPKNMTGFAYSKWLENNRTFLNGLKKKIRA